MAWFWDLLLWLLPPVLLTSALLEQYLHRRWLLILTCSIALMLVVTVFQLQTLWWTPILLLIGLALCILELIIPGFSFIGASGILLALFSLFLITSGHQFLLRLVILSAPLVFVPPLNRKYGLPQLVPKSMIHTTVNDVSAGYIAHVLHDELLEMEGITLTPLRPSGLARISGQRYDVTCTEPYLEAHVPVRVIRVLPGKIIVEPLPKQDK